MAWPSREINYQEEFGVSSKEELLNKLKKVTELETSNTTLQTQVTTASGELNTVKATLAALEERMNAASPNNNNNNNNNNNTVEIPSVADDENAAFATRMAPLYQQGMENTAMIIEDKTLRRLSAGDPRFPKMEKEIRELIAQTPLQFRANVNRDKAGKTYAEQVIENAYYIVKGRYSDQITQDTIAGKGEFFVESARSAGNTGAGGGDKTDPLILTDDDRRVIQRMGITEKTYLEVIKGGGPNMGGALSNKTSL